MSRRDAGDGERLILDPGDPLPSAAAFVARRHTQGGTRTLHRHAGGFHAYTGTHYREVPGEALRAELYAFLEPAVHRSATGKGELLP